MPGERVYACAVYRRKGSFEVFQVGRHPAHHISTESSACSNDTRTLPQAVTWVASLRDQTRNDRRSPSGMSSTAESGNVPRGTKAAQLSLPNRRDISWQASELAKCNLPERGKSPMSRQFPVRPEKRASPKHGAAPQRRVQGLRPRGPGC